MSKRARTEAYTLVELMIVVVIIGIFVGLAAPRINRQLVDRRTNEIALAVMNHLREALTRSVGGRAHVVTFDASDQGSLTLERATTNRCTAPFAVLKTYTASQDERGNTHFVAITLDTPSSRFAQFCFVSGRLQGFRTSATGRFIDAGDGFVFGVQGTRDSLIRRRVLLPFGSAPRVFL